MLEISQHVSTECGNTTVESWPNMTSRLLNWLVNRDSSMSQANWNSGDNTTCEEAEPPLKSIEALQKFGTAFGGQKWTFFCHRNKDEQNHMFFLLRDFLVKNVKTWLLTGKKNLRTTAKFSSTVSSAARPKASFTTSQPRPTWKVLGPSFNEWGQQNQGLHNNHVELLLLWMKIMSWKKNVIK